MKSIVKTQQKSNPQLSKTPTKSQNSKEKPKHTKDELKHVQNQIQTMKNKINLLRLQLKREQSGIKKNKSMTEGIIKKKIIVNKIQQYKTKDTSQVQLRAEILKKRNASLRESHQSEMQNILKAIYLVKLDDARQIKNASKSYQRKIQEQNQSRNQRQQEIKKKIVEQSQAAKQKYEIYWRQKLSSIYEDQLKSKEQDEKIAEQRKNQLRQLQQQQIKLLEEMNKIHSRNTQAKKQYLAALSLPVKQVADALGKSSPNLQNNSTRMSRLKSNLSRYNQNNSSMEIDQSLLMDQSIAQKNSRLGQFSHKEMKVPNSTVNPNKLKIILKQLKRMQKKQKNAQKSKQKSDQQ